MELYDSEFQQVDRNDRHSYAEPRRGAAEIEFLKVKAVQDQCGDDRQEQYDDAEQNHPDDSDRGREPHKYRAVLSVNAAEEYRGDRFSFQNLFAPDQLPPLAMKGSLSGSEDLSARFD